VPYRATGKRQNSRNSAIVNSSAIVNKSLPLLLSNTHFSFITGPSIFNPLPRRHFESQFAIGPIFRAGCCYLQ
jgi:hypothetical protein